MPTTSLTMPCSCCGPGREFDTIKVQSFNNISCPPLAWQCPAITVGTSGYNSSTILYNISCPPPPWQCPALAVGTREGILIQFKYSPWIIFHAHHFPDNALLLLLGPGREFDKIQVLSMNNISCPPLPWQCPAPAVGTRERIWYNTSPVHE